MGDTVPKLPAVVAREEEQSQPPGLRALARAYANIRMNRLAKSR